MALVVATTFTKLQKKMAEVKHERSKTRQAGATGEVVDHNSSGYRERVYEVVRRIPAGRVMTYGQVAEIAGEHYTARTVGFVMHAADETVPWHRVINAQGACSTDRILLPHGKQQRLLEAEGIEFDARGRCDLGRYRSVPDDTTESKTGTTNDIHMQTKLFDD